MNNKSAVAIVCFNRARELQKTLDSIEFASFAAPERVIVCQLGDPEVERIVRDLDSTKFRKFFLPARKDNESSMCLINRNVHKAISECFKLNVDRVIILEDDIEVHPHFFEFVSQMHEVHGADPKFRAINGFSAYSNSNKDTIGYGKYVYGVGWGWSINRTTWINLQKYWQGNEDLHWDGLIEPYIRTGFVVMPNWSLILNNGLAGNGTHSGENRDLYNSIKASFECNSISSSKYWQYNQIDLNWRSDCFTHMNPKSIKGFIQQLLNYVLFKSRDKSGTVDFPNKIRQKIRSVSYLMLSSIK